MFEPNIGLECHVQLDTASKLFCRCRVADGGPPNSRVCPVCLGHPGTLPLPNAKAVALAVRAALALSFTLHPTSTFARKQYFYPDLPKGYQITQYDRPLATGGAVHVDGRRFGLTRLHLEEDSGKSSHRGEATLVDFNRAGTALVEVVGEPDLHSAAAAEAWLRLVHRVLVRAGVTRGDLDKGHFRCDANVSLPGGARVEVKNVNSFRFVARALSFEIERQRAVVAAGGTVLRETRTWRAGATLVLRAKEDTEDYRYLPEPDLPPLHVDDAMVAAARRALPGVPLDVWLTAQDRRDHAAFVARFGVDDAVAGLVSGDRELSSLFEATVEAGADPGEVAKWVAGPLLQRRNAGRPATVAPGGLARLIALVQQGALSRNQAREVFDALCEGGVDPDAIVHARGLSVLDDPGALDAVISRVIARSPSEVARYRAGQQSLIGYFMGEVMRDTDGRADPALARRLVVQALSRV